MDISVPEQSEAIIRIPINAKSLEIEGQGKLNLLSDKRDGKYNYYSLTSGQWYVKFSELNTVNMYSIIHPNPNKGEFNIKLNIFFINKSFSIAIFDIKGSMIYFKKIKNLENLNQKINLENIKSGVYFLSINDGIKKYSNKFIVN